MNRDLGFLSILSHEDKLLAARVLDAAEMSEEKHMDKFTFFLDEHQQMLCRKVLGSVCFEKFRFFGGYDTAQRQILGTFAPYSEPEDIDFPIKAFTFTYRRSDHLTHRDFLGCLMSLGIERDTVGDIIVSEGRTVVFVCDSVALPVGALEKIGRVGVKVSEGFELDAIPVQEYKDISGTVASLRLDCVLSLALRISREKAADLIRSTGAEVNYVSVNSQDTRLCGGDVFSVRGYGKFRLADDGVATKKDRIFITVKKYV